MHRRTQRKSTRYWVMLGLIVLVLGTVLVAGQALAQEAESASGSQPSQITLWRLIKAGGFIGLIIILMSVSATALIIEHFLTIRRNMLVPEDLAVTLEELLKEKKYEEAERTAKADDSLLGEVVGAGLAQKGALFGYFDMQNAMQETSERHVSRLYRKLEYLTFIAATAPMMGLLGTVTGMIGSFNEIAASEGMAKPSQLAGGISEALVTTCFGLVVAIPAMFFVAMFRNRIDSLIAEAEAVVERLMGGFRRGQST